LQPGGCPLRRQYQLPLLLEQAVVQIEQGAIPRCIACDPIDVIDAHKREAFATRE
jgi:hypothetical protein